MSKLVKLTGMLKQAGRMLIAYSGGVDSTFLLKSALDVLGKENVLAVIAGSETYPSHEKQEALELCAELGANYQFIKTNELGNELFVNNPKERCYHCKIELFENLNRIAKENGFRCVADGSNADDLNDFRPGAKAKNELGVVSPLQEAGFTKDEIRALSKEMGLRTWDKPSYACLASRIPYGSKIKPETLKRIEEAEDFLRSLGFKQLRVRHHDNLARIELEANDIPKLMREDLMGRINRKFGELGYFFVTVDLKGYRTGSMNEMLTQ